MFSYPAVYIASKADSIASSLPSLPDDVFLAFPVKSTSTLHGFSLSRLRKSLTLVLAVTDYKAQGATFKYAVFDLDRGENPARESLIKICARSMSNYQFLTVSNCCNE